MAVGSSRPGTTGAAGTMASNKKRVLPDIETYIETGAPMHQERLLLRALQLL